MGVTPSEGVEWGRVSTNWRFSTFNPPYHQLQQYTLYSTSIVQVHKDRLVHPDIRHFNMDWFQILGSVFAGSIFVGCFFLIYVM